MRKIWLLLACVLAGALPAQAGADPWAQPGDLTLRHDLTVLADAGVIDAPITSWPIPWASIISGLDAAGTRRDLPPAVAAAFGRVSRRVQEVRQARGIQPNAKLAARSSTIWLRGFEDVPREEGELRAGASWMGDRFAFRLQASALKDPVDDDEVRLAGSYASVVLGNHILTAGERDRWWGPGWDSSMIFSSNAWPMPAITLQRNAAEPFETRWLSWIGPWTYDLVWGFLDDDRVVDDARVLAFRVAFRPLDDLEIGLSRAATWCGTGQSCATDTLLDIILGQDNFQEEGTPRDEDPSNQMAAIDARWHSPFGDAPYALYTQWVANDEVNGLPSEWALQVGVEYFGSLETRWLAGDYVGRLEVTETIPEFWENEPAYDRLYDHFLYETGYRYGGRALGAAMDNDGISISLGGTLVEAGGDHWDAGFRWTRINRRGDGAGKDLFHTVSPFEQDVWTLKLSHARSVALDGMDLGVLRGGVGLQYFDRAESGIGGSETDLQLYLQWNWDLEGL